MDKQTVSMNKFYEFDAERPYKERILAHSRLDIVIKQVTKFIKRIPNKVKLLDIGITDGYILEQMDKRRVESYGLDIAFQTLKEIKIHFHSKEGFISHLTQGSIIAIPFQTDSVDVVTACEILEHMSDQNLSFALRELYRILRPGGRLFITTPYHENVKSSLIKCPKCGVVFSA